MVIIEVWVCYALSDKDTSVMFAFTGFILAMIILFVGVKINWDTDN